MPWTFEDAAPMIGTITEGNCWTGKHMLYSNVALNRIMRLDVKSGLVDVFAENTEGTNGLNYDADGNLYGCAGTGRASRQIQRRWQLRDRRGQRGGSASKRPQRPRDHAFWRDLLLRPRRRFQSRSWHPLLSHHLRGKGR